jgi:hypothetical protein
MSFWGVAARLCARYDRTRADLHEAKHMIEPSSRRGFFRTAGALALATPAFGAEPRLYDGEIIDTHLHLWDLSVIRPPWIESATGRAKEVLAHDYKLADFAEASKGLKVTRAVYMEVDVAESDEIKEADYVTRICTGGKSPMEAAVISGRVQRLRRLP